MRAAIVNRHRGEIEAELGGTTYTLVLTLGALGGLLMWGSLNFVIWPSLKVVLGHTVTDAQAQARARQTVKRYARLNLVLALPVTFIMVAAAHLS